MRFELFSKNNRSIGLSREEYLRTSAKVRETAVSLVRKLREPTEKILNQIQPEIERGEYKMILGEDASGRLPALLMHMTLSSIYAKKGYPKLHTRFVTGFRDSGWLHDPLRKKERTFREYARKLKTTLDAEGGGRVLIVTDTIQEGKSLKPLVKILNEIGIDYDIATLGLYPVDVEDRRTTAQMQQARLERRWKRRIIFGGTIAPEIQRNKKYSGVTKNNPGIHARMLREGDSYVAHRGGEKRRLYDEFTQLRIETTRTETRLLAGDIVEEYSRNGFSKKRV